MTHAKIDPTIVMDYSMFKIGGWNHLQQPYLVEESVMNTNSAY